MTPEEAAALPWDTPGLLLVPGRYYVGMYNVRLPKVIHPPYGGDITGLLWRYEATPGDWVFVYRFRWYQTPGEDAEGKDRKSWYAGKIQGTEQKAQDMVRNLMRIASGAAVLTTGCEAPIDFLEVRGDSNKAWQAMMEANKSWLHVTARIPLKK